MVNSFEKVIEMERSMRFWKERMKNRMNGFGKLGDSLGMGSCNAPVAVFADGDRYSGRERQVHAPTHHALSRRGQRKPMGEVRSFSL